MRKTKNWSLGWSSYVFCSQMSQHYYFCNLYKAFQKHISVPFVCDEWNVDIWRMNYGQKNEVDLLRAGFWHIQIAMSNIWPIYAWFISWKEKSKDSQTINTLIPGSGSLPSVGWIRPDFTFFGSGLLSLSPRWLKHSDLHNSWEVTVNWQ